MLERLVAGAWEKRRVQCIEVEVVLDIRANGLLETPSGW